MSAPLEICAREEIRAIIRYLRSKKKCAAEIYREIIATYGSHVIDARNVRGWVKMFDEGRTSIFDDERSGRPITAKTSTNVQRVQNLIFENCRIRIVDIADD